MSKAPTKPNRDKLLAKIARITAHIERHPRDAASAAHKAKMEARL